MSRTERIRDYIETAAVSTKDGFQGVDTREVSEALSIWRTDVSAILNRLCESGILKKRAGKPVKYFPSSIMETTDTIEEQRVILDDSSASKIAFTALAGCRGSLKAQIETAKAAVLYPPDGLHTLIIGETGVGKSLFAEEMWKCAVEEKEEGRDSGEIPYIVFNCAEYADNPQLLLSQLFGHVKGAFTGAKEDKPGLVEMADGGILFLDEIHRLPHTGQEIFFMLLDRGRYRRLGDTVNRKSSIMIIGATSEDPASTLLSTFKRRMPVLIQIPNLAKRSLDERLNLISLFLFQEANRLGCSIFVSGSALKVLVSYKPKANIGDLKNDLQLCCARSYLSYRLMNTAEGIGQAISIDIPDLPQRVYLAASDRDIPVWALSKSEFSNGLMLQPGNKPPCSNESAIDAPLDLYDFIKKQRSSYIQQRFSNEIIENLSMDDLEEYWDKSTDLVYNSELMDKKRVQNIVSSAVWDLSKALLEKAELHLKRTYPVSIQTSLAMHFQQFVERLNSGQIIYNPNVQHIKLKYPDEMDFIEKNTEFIAEKLSIIPSLDELCFLAMFLRKAKDLHSSHVHVGLVVAAHGDSMATSIADFTNQILKANIVRAVNASPKKDLDVVFQEICQAVKAADKGSGVLLLVDSGSFTFFRNRIIKETGVLCRTFQNVNSLIALEAARIVLSGEVSLNCAYSELLGFSRHFYQQMITNNQEIEQAGIENSMDNIESDNIPVLLIICSTGIGTALKLKELLIENIPAASSAEIFTASVLDDITSIADNYNTRLCMIIGSNNPEIKKIPFFNAEEVLYKRGLSEIEKCLVNWGSYEITEKKVDALQDESILELLAQNVERFAPSLPRTMVIDQVRFVVDKIERDVFQIPFSPDATVRIYMHVMTLFERLAQKCITDKSELQDMEKERQPEVFNAIFTIMSEACEPLGLKFPEEELYYMVISLPGKV